MIPRVRPWLVRVSHGRAGESRVTVYAPTKLLAKLNFRADFPQFWGHDFKISPKRWRTSS